MITKIGCDYLKKPTDRQYFTSMTWAFTVKREAIFENPFTFHVKKLTFHTTSSENQQERVERRRPEDGAWRMSRAEGNGAEIRLENV
ncbi:MAG: hypothetical protein KH366_24985 [Clostridiaceae bacterium]|nr:hypothetical protein [Clostridiaceae bacterium]